MNASPDRDNQGPLGRCDGRHNRGSADDRGTEKRNESAISRVLSWATIHLGQPSPAASSDLPGSPFGRTVRTEVLLLPYLVLLQAGFSLPRCVTTRAVRSYRTFSPLPALAHFGGVFSVALSMGSHPPGVTWRPARRSPDFPPALVARQRLPGRLRAASYAKALRPAVID